LIAFADPVISIPAINNKVIEAKLNLILGARR
jgi:hypothetical protein